MSEQYREMWQQLGLDLAAHDALLGVLGPYYQETFLTQPNRPQGMEYFNFVMGEVHGLRIKELLDAQAQGRIVVGSFCTFVPEELVVALDGVMVGLCAGAEFAPQLVDQVLPRATCSLIRGAFGFAMAKVCPYLAAADLIVGETTCDGKKKAWELFGQFTKELYVLEIPNTKSAEGRALYRAELGRLVTRLEELARRTMTAEALRSAIEKVNAKRAVMHRLARLRAADPAPISGLDALLINQVYFYDDLDRFTAQVGEVVKELEERVAAREGVTSAGSPRLLMSGCPMAVPNWKVPSIVERAGAVIVGEESCIGERGLQNLVEVRGNTVDELLDAIAERYMTIDCAIFTPNLSRRQHIRQMAADYKADGVIHYGLNFCHPYQIEGGLVERELEGAGIPALRIDTDYSPEDAEQIRLRVEAFLERLRP